MIRRGGSSVGQSIGLIIRGSSVRARPAPPIIPISMWIYMASGFNKALVTMFMSTKCQQHSLLSINNAQKNTDS